MPPKGNKNSIYEEVSDQPENFSDTFYETPVHPPAVRVRQGAKQTVSGIGFVIEAFIWSFRDAFVFILDFVYQNGIALGIVALLMAHLLFMNLVNLMIGPAIGVGKLEPAQITAIMLTMLYVLALIHRLKGDPLNYRKHSRGR